MRRLALLAMVALAACSRTTAVQADASNGPIVAQSLGVAAHKPTADDLHRMSALGLRYVRTDVTWASTERKQGVYDFSRTIAIAQQARVNGLRPILILDYGNVVWTPSVSVRHHGSIRQVPTPPRARKELAAFSRWVAAAARVLSRYDPVWEIWNEPDLPVYWPPQPDANDYGRVALTACKAIRAAGPAEIIGPASAKWVDGKFLAELLHNRALTCFDRISVHPYQMNGDMVHDTALWGDLKARINAGGVVRHRAIANSEWGRSVIGQASADAQAIYLVRSLVAALSAGVTPNIWYDWRDDGNDPTNDQHHFGLLFPDGRPKPAYTALQTLIAQVGKMRFVCPVESGGIEGGLFATPDHSQAVAVLWSEGFRGLIEKWLGTSSNFTPTGWRANGIVDIAGKEVDPMSSVTRSPLFVRLMPLAGRTAVPSCMRSR